jgi:hypothetical protein
MMRLWRLCSTSTICDGLCSLGNSVPVLLYTAEASVLATCYLLAGVFCLWCRIVAEAADRFHGLVVGAVGWGWIACMLD